MRRNEKNSSSLEPLPDVLPRPSDDTPHHAARILLAEDNAINQKVALRQLQKLGYHADAVADGNEVLEALQRIPYDIILMDCQMPELDGYQATQRIRRDFSASKQPVYIIAMTAHAMQGDREKCLAAGMNDYVTKPVCTSELQAALARWQPQQDPEPESEQVQDQEPDFHPEEDCPLDLAQLQEVSDGDPDMMRELIELCLEQADEVIPALEAAISAGSAQEVNSLAHKLRGASSTCGMVSLVPALQELERMGKSGDLTNAPLFHRRAVAELSRIRRFLSDHFPGGVTLID